MSTVAEQREKMITTLATLTANQDNLIAYTKEKLEGIDKKIDKQNGKVNKNANNIQRIIGIGIGISAVLSIAISLLALL